MAHSCHGEEDRFEEELAMALKLSKFTHECEEGARVDEDISLALADQEAPTPCAMALPPPGADELDDDLARAIKASMEEAAHRPSSLLQEGADDDEVAAAIRASMESEQQDEMRREAQAAEDLSIATQLSLSEHQALRVPSAPSLDLLPLAPPLASVAETAVGEEGLTTWTLKMHLGCEARRVRVSWPRCAGSVEVFAVICKAAKDTYDFDVALMSGADFAPLRYLDESGDEAGLIPATVDDFLTFGEKGLLRLLLKKPPIKSEAELDVRNTQQGEARDEPATPQPVPVEAADSSQSASPPASPAAQESAQSHSVSIATPPESPRHLIKDEYEQEWAAVTSDDLTDFEIVEAWPEEDGDGSPAEEANVAVPAEVPLTTFTHDNGEPTAPRSEPTAQSS
mmetsp:Transcript_24288/g.56400  ORF Transcript_24288/g.56400 Transcript_24288/m.56400 type:complete len:398 (-) Transcript_24288:183-1376(-)